MVKRDLSSSDIEEITKDTDLDTGIRPEIAALTAHKGTVPSLLDVVVSRLEGHGRKAHEVWLPPLDISPATDELLTELDLYNREGTNLSNLEFPLGIVDKPYEQRRDAFAIDVSGAQGNVAIVGGPQSGKSNTLRTMIVSAAFSHTPEQVQFYCLDFGGGTLNSIADLPHVGSVANRMDEDRVRRTIAEVTTLLRQREERFQRLGIETMRDFRKLKAAYYAGELDEKYADIAEDNFGDLFLVIDGWSAIRGEFESLEDSINMIAGQGLSYGIHLVITASRWAEVRPVVKDQIGTRIELRLGDPTESEMGRRVAMTVPVGRPGRGITPENLHMLIGLPRMDSSGSTDDLSEAVQQTVEMAKEIYPSRKAAPVRMLPDRVDREEVLALAPAMSPRMVALGLNEAELAPAFVDFDANSYFVIFGDNECGKTTVLRNIAMGIMENSTPEQSRILVADYRRTLLGVVKDDYLVGYAPTAESLTAMLGQVYQILQQRVPGPDVTQQELRDRSWWSGPEVYVIVDDYDLVATSGGNPIAVLLDLLAQSKDIGLHVIIARRSGGASRALYEPVLGRLKDLSVDGLVMSGTKDEGALIGNTRGAPMPPGRGNYVTRNGVELVQVSYLPSLG